MAEVLKPLFGALSEPRGAVRRQAELATVVLLRRASEDVQSLSFAAQQLAQMLQQAKGEKKEEIPAQRARGPSVFVCVGLRNHSESGGIFMKIKMFDRFLSISIGI